MKTIDSGSNFNRKILRRDFNSNLHHFSERNHRSLQKYASYYDPNDKDTEDDEKKTTRFSGDIAKDTANKINDAVPSWHGTAAKKELIQNPVKTTSLDYHRLQTQAIRGTGAIPSGDKTSKAVNAVSFIKNQTGKKAVGATLQSAGNIKWFIIILAPFILIFCIVYGFLIGLPSLFSNALNRVPTLTIAQVLTYLEEHHKNYVASEAASVSDLDNGVLPIIYNYDINWYDVLAVFYAYTIDKEIDTAGMKIDGTSYSYLEAAFNATNKVCTDFNASYYLPSDINPTYLYYFQGENYSVITLEYACLVLHYNPTPYAAAEELGFNDVEMAALNEFVKPQYHEFYDQIINMMDLGDGSALVQTALNEVGNDLHKYCNWFGTETEWCAVFVSWCASQNGYIASGIVPKSASVPAYYRWFKDPSNPGYFIYTYNGAITPGSITPQPGWFVIYERDENHNTLNHIGIVESYDAATNTLHTIEGNSGAGSNKYERRVVHYNNKSWNSQIWGFCVPAYPKIETYSLTDYYTRIINVSREYTPSEDNDAELRTILNSSVDADFRRTANRIIEHLENGIEIPSEVYDQYNANPYNSLDAYEIYMSTH